ncbi:MAG: hypothetical protein ACXAEU_19755 [Candidatus Hodarchaeales archaeon]|jgi:hypothetical protein
MIKVHIYGHLKKKFDANASLAGNMIIEMSFIEDETLANLKKRLELTTNECGECFVNHKVASDHGTIIPDESRVAIFSSGMFLLCGGQHLKGHGYITKKIERTSVPDYYDK